jgi:hypothetical protein
MPDLFEAVGSETRVNGGPFSYYGDQIVPQVVRLANGELVVVFTSNSTIVTQRYDATGNAIGGETVISPISSNFYADPAITALASGGYAISYTRQPSGGGDREIFVRSFDAAGNALGAALQLAVGTAGPEQSSVLTALPGGGFVAVWTNAGADGDGLGVFTQQFDAGGSAIGSATQVNIGITGDQSDPAVTVLDGGGYVVTWRAGTANNASDGEILARVFDASGVAQGSEIAVNLTTLADQSQPAISALAGGGFVIAWTSVNQDRLGGSGVILQRFDANGSRLGSETVVNSFVDGAQFAPAIARLTNGDFLVSWTSAIQDGSRAGVYAQIYSSNGDPQGREFRASTTVTGDQSAPAVVGTADGGFAMVYQSPDPSFSGVYMQRYAPSTALGALNVAGTLSVVETALDRSLVAELSTNQANDATTFSIIADSSGGAFGIVDNQLVVAENGWLDFEAQTAVMLTVRAISGNGQQIDRQITVQVTNGIDEVRFGGDAIHSGVVREGTTTDVVALSGGGFAMAWQDRVAVFNPFLNAMENQTAILVRVVDESGAIINQSQQILTNQFFASSPVIAATADNGFVVGWSAESGSNPGFSLQFFNAAGNPAGAPQLAIPDATPRDGPAEMITLSNGDLLTLASRFDNVTLQWGVMLRRFASDGTVLDAGTQIIARPAGAFFMAAVALPDGGYLLDYAETIPGAGGSRNYVQRYDAAGSTVGAALQIGSDAITVRAPDVAVLANGGFVVSWSGTTTYQDVNTYIQLFDASGNPLAVPQIIDPDPGSTFQTSVIGLPDGSFVVEWMTVVGLKLQRFGADGSLLAAAPSLIAGPYALQQLPALAVSASGDFIASWFDPNGNTTTGYYDQVWQTFDLKSFYGTEGDDTLTGTASGELGFGYGGNDTLIGSGGVDRLYGGSGNDRLILSTTSGGSAVDGGADADTLAVTGAVALTALTGIEAIELQSGATLTLTGSQFATGLAINTTISGTGSITVNMDAGVNFSASGMTFAGTDVAMVVNGTSGVDIIKLGLGNSGNNTVNGGDGVDQIRGSQRVDTINGDGGNDKIMSLGGADVLTGGGGNDQFRYFSSADSGVGVANSDRITDFTIGVDRLNFALIDADAALAGDQEFSFIGTDAFTNTGVGQIRYTNSGTDLLVQADVNGDGVVDMEIILQGLNGGTLTAGDFIL